MKCPYCRSKDTVWRGYRYNESGEKRLMKCARCRRKFTPGNYKRMRYSPKTIERSIKLYKKEKSSAKVKEILSRSGIKVSRWTILKWSRKKFK